MPLLLNSSSETMKKPLAKRIASFFAALGCRRNSAQNTTARRSGAASEKKNSVGELTVDVAVPSTGSEKLVSVGDVSVKSGVEKGAMEAQEQSVDRASTADVEVFNGESKAQGVETEKTTAKGISEAENETKEDADASATTKEDEDEDEPIDTRGPPMKIRSLRTGALELDAASTHSERKQDGFELMLENCLCCALPGTQVSVADEMREIAERATEEEDIEKVPSQAPSTTAVTVDKTPSNVSTPQEPDVVSTHTKEKQNGFELTLVNDLCCALPGTQISIADQIREAAVGANENLDIEKVPSTVPSQALSAAAEAAEVTIEKTPSKMSTQSQAVSSPEEPQAASLPPVDVAAE